MEAGPEVDETAVDIFLDRELGSAREGCLVVHLVRLSDQSPPKIIDDQPMGSR